MNCFTVDQYIAQCYTCCTQNEKPKFVVVQICCAHFIRIAEKDIKSLNKDESFVSFYKLQMFRCVNISNMSEFFTWLRLLLTILLNPTKNPAVLESLRILEDFDEIDRDEKENSKKVSNDASSFNASYKNSPFYHDAIKILKNMCLTPHYGQT